MRIIRPKAASITNPNNSYEFVGFGTGGGVLVTANDSNHVKTTTPVQIGVATSAFSKHMLYLANGSATAIRIVYDLSFDGGSTWPVSNVFEFIGGSTLGHCKEIPILIPSPAGADFRMRIQSTTGNATVHAYIVGVVANASAPPGFSSLTGLNIDLATTRADNADVAFNGTWLELVASSAAEYGALIVTTDGGTAAGTATQSVGLGIGVGEALSEQLIGQTVVNSTTTGITIRSPTLLIEKTIPISSRIAARVIAASNTTDTIRVAIHGYA
jgi:hypothetical protein